MYAKYTYKATATQAQVLRDIILILTGTTNTASLSASCDTALSSIDASYVAAGWNDNDSAASANTTQCCRSSMVDAASTYAYAVLTTTATTLSIGCYDGWNSGTHAVSGNGAVSSSTLTVASIGTASQTLYIWADAYSIYINKAAGTIGLGIYQLSRANAWQTDANGCRPVVCHGTAVGTPTTVWSAAVPFMMRNLNGTPAYVYPGTAYNNCYGPTAEIAADNSATPSSTLQVRDSTLSAANVLFRLVAGSGYYGGGGTPWTLFGSVTDISPIYAVGLASAPAVDDIVNYNAESYKVIGVHGANKPHMCVRIA